MKKQRINQTKIESAIEEIIILEKIIANKQKIFSQEEIQLAQNRIESIMTELTPQELYNLVGQLELKKF